MAGMQASGGVAHAGGANPPEGQADNDTREGPERFWGCGWFDSSLDLQQGLTVVEHREVEAELVVALLFERAPRRRPGASAA